MSERAECKADPLPVSYEKIHRVLLMDRTADAPTATVQR
jgi:hypothetical protein